MSSLLNCFKFGLKGKIVSIQNNSVQMATFWTKPCWTQVFSYEKEAQVHNWQCENKVVGGKTHEYSLHKHQSGLRASPEPAAETMHLKMRLNTETLWILKAAGVTFQSVLRPNHEPALCKRKSEFCQSDNSVHRSSLKSTCIWTWRRAFMLRCTLLFYKITRTSLLWLFVDITCTQALTDSTDSVLEIYCAPCNFIHLLHEKQSQCSSLCYLKLC